MPEEKSLRLRHERRLALLSDSERSFSAHLASLEGLFASALLFEDDGDRVVVTFDRSGYDAWRSSETDRFVRFVLRDFDLLFEKS